MMVSPKAAEAAGDKFVLRPVCAGPYKFVSYVPGDRVVMARNDNYWGGKQPWEKVNYRYINNAAARTANLLSGEVDVIDKVSVADLARLRQSPSVHVFAYPGLRVMLLQPSFRKGPNEYITGNDGKPLANNPLLDVRVRQALSLAIDRKAIVDRIVDATHAAMADADFQKVLLAAGLEPVPDSNSEKAKRFMDEEIARWGPVVKASGFKVE